MGGAWVNTLMSFNAGYNPTNNLNVSDKSENLSTKRIKYYTSIKIVLLFIFNLRLSIKINLEIT